MTELTIHTYTASEQGLHANSYLLETPEEIVLVDANLLVSDAMALAARLAALHKPLVAAFVTHAHPDHFNGLPYIVPDDVPVYAAAEVASVIGEIAVPKREQWQPLYGEEWPESFRVPEPLQPRDASVDVAGLHVAVHALGAGESHADSYLVVDDGTRRVAFIGDLAFDGVHSYTADGHISAWLAVLDQIAPQLTGMRLYPGHGAPRGADLLDDQRRYLLMYRETVRRLAGGAADLTDAQKAELTGLMCRFLPGAALSWLVAHGADAVAAELAAERTGVNA